MNNENTLYNVKIYILALALIYCDLFIFTDFFFQIIILYRYVRIMYVVRKHPINPSLPGIIAVSTITLSCMLPLTAPANHRLQGFQIEKNI